MSSRTAACGHPPVSMARIRSGESALWRVRNSASSLCCFVRLVAVCFRLQDTVGHRPNRHCVDLLGEDIVRHGRDIVLFSEGEAQGKHQSRLS